MGFSLRLLTSWRPLATKATWQSIGGKPKRADRWREDRRRQTDSEERINTEALTASQHTNRPASLDVSFYTIMSVNRRWFALHASCLEAINKSTYDPKGRGVHLDFFQSSYETGSYLSLVFRTQATMETVAASNFGQEAAFSAPPN